MKNFYILPLLILSLFDFSIVSIGQTNLVTNPSFEQFSVCPTSQSQVQYAIGWDNYGRSPDYFNACSINPNFSIPFNWGGYQPAVFGNGYCAIGTYVPLVGNAREFIGNQLTSSLVIGTKYYVSFKVCLSFSDAIKAYIATNKNGSFIHNE